MAYDLEEQEQLDEFKAWWKLHGQKVVVLITTLVVVYLGYQGWHYYQDQQSLKASTQYENLLKLDITDAKNLKAIQSVSAQLMDKYSSTPYAGRAALTAAKANFFKMKKVLCHVNRKRIPTFENMESLSTYEIEHRKRWVIRQLSVLAHIPSTAVLGD